MDKYFRILLSAVFSPCMYVSVSVCMCVCVLALHNYNMKELGSKSKESVNWPPSEPFHTNLTTSGISLLLQAEEGPVGDSQTHKVVMVHNTHRRCFLTCLDG